MTSPQELWVPPGVDRPPPAKHRKAAPPALGPAYGSWGGEQARYQTLQLPGGSVMQFDLSRLTLADYRQMRNHYQINASLLVLMFTLHQLDWWIECEDRKIAEFVETNMRQVWTRFIRAISQAYWAGFSPIAIEYEQDSQDGRVRINKFKDLLPERSEVNWKEVPGRVAPGSGGAGVRPKRYVYDGIKQEGQQGHIPVENTIWYPVLMENGDMRGRKLLRPAFPPYFMSQLIHLYTNRYFERFGEPQVVARAPFDEDIRYSDGTSTSGRDAAVNMIQDLRSRGGVVLPNDRSMGGNGDKNDFDYTIDFLESQMRGADFDRYLSKLDEEMSLAMFVPILLFRTADVGSYNLGQAHERTFMFQINGLAGDLAEYLDRFVLSRLVDYNFSPKAPRARFAFRRMGKDTDETLRAIMLASIQQQFLRPDIDELGLALGMKLHEIRQVTDPEGGDLQPADDPNTEGTNQGETNDDASPQTQDSRRQSPNTNLSSAVQRMMTQLNKGNIPTEIGYSRKMVEDLMRSGVEYEVAQEKVSSAWGVAEQWMQETAAFSDMPTAQIGETVEELLAACLS